MWELEGIDMHSEHNVLLCSYTGSGTTTNGTRWRRASITSWAASAGSSTTERCPLRIETVKPASVKSRLSRSVNTDIQSPGLMWRTQTDCYFPIDFWGREVLLRNVLRGLPKQKEWWWDDTCFSKLSRNVLHWQKHDRVIVTVALLSSEHVATLFIERFTFLSVWCFLSLFCSITANRAIFWTERGTAFWNHEHE